MKYQLLGSTSIEVSALSYGMWRFGGTDVDVAQAKIEAAMDIGITLFDQADVYGVDGGGRFGDSELLLGEVFRRSPALRNRMVLATKGGIVLGTPYNSSKEYIRKAVEDSLRRMNVDHIDLYQIHRPDVCTHPAELAEVLYSLRQEGKIREVGVSNYTTSQCRALQSFLPFALVSRQPQFSCRHLDPLKDGTLDHCMEQNLSPLAWSPMGGGILGLSMKKAQEVGGASLVDLLTILDRIAKEQSVTRGAVALAWILSHPAGVIPILGTQTIARITQSARAFDVELDRQTWYKILVAPQGEPLP